MKYLSDRYTAVYSYAGYDICTLKAACPRAGESLGYIIDSKEFAGSWYEDIASALSAIKIYMNPKSLSSSVGGDRSRN